MSKKKKSTVDVTAAKEYLETYRVYESLLLYGRYLFARQRDVSGGKPIDVVAAKAAMLRVKSFILHLPDCREKMMLYYRYLHGRTVEQCAELMGISRRTAFRVAKKALILAAENLAGR